MIKEIVIDGNNFYDIEGFYCEIDRALTKDLGWHTGHNLNAFNDLLSGGFGVHEYEEPIVLIWCNAEKSREDLGYGETIRHYKKLMLTCHPTNISSVKLSLDKAKKKTGDTLFDILVRIIREHEHIELVLK